MPWEQSDRRYRLPKDWAKIRARILKRDRHRCRVCGQKANQVDHVIPSGPDTDNNLQSLCAPHHAAKSASEGGRSVRKGRRVTKALDKTRPSEQHPGLTRQDQ